MVEVLDVGQAARSRAGSKIERKREGCTQQRFDIQVRGVPDVADEGVRQGDRHALSCMGQQAFLSNVHFTGGVT